jgi:SM-20-related protein
VANVFRVENFLDDETCRKIIGDLRTGSEAPAWVYGGQTTAGVERNIRRAARIEVPAHVQQDVAKRFRELMEPLEKQFGVSLTEIEAPQFLRYRPGDFFVAHQDGNTPLVHDDTRFRKLSVVVFLNTQSIEPESGTYGGGSLVFYEPFPHHDQRYPLVGAPGTLVAFPSETTHEVIPVAHGERYTIVSWYR